MHKLLSDKSAQWAFGRASVFEFEEAFSYHGVVLGLSPRLGGQTMDKALTGSAKRWF